MTRKTSGNIKKEEKSGNMREENSKNAGFIKTIEPVTTLLDEEKIVRIRSELPGIAEEKIRIDLDNRLSNYLGIGYREPVQKSNFPTL